MTIIYILLPLALLLGLSFLTAFVWGTMAGQFDELDSPATKILTPEDLQTQGRKYD